MTITVTFRDGTTLVVSSCSLFEPDGPNGTLKLVGTSAEGTSASWWIPWDVVQFVQQEP